MLLHSETHFCEQGEGEESPGLSPAFSLLHPLGLCALGSVLHLCEFQNCFLKSGQHPQMSPCPILCNKRKLKDASLLGGGGC